MAEILRGAPVADAISEKLAERCAALERRGVRPTLAIVRVGERPDDVAYERAALRRCERVGVAARLFMLPADAGRGELLRAIDEINGDGSVHGCLMFRPLPGHLDEAEARGALRPEKDVDGMTASSLAGVFTGSGEGFAPCTAQSVMELLHYYGIDPAGRRAAVIGRSLVIGRPVAMLLQAENATVTMCHTRTRELPELCRGAEILVAAAGCAGMVDAGFVNPRQVVIDVGVNAAPEGGLCGDVKFGEVEPLVRAIAPVPGGVGSVTTAVLCAHVVEAAERRAP